MPSVAQIFRHTIKSVGRESCAYTDLQAGKTMAGDRVWAIADTQSRIDPAAPEWMSCANFIRGAKAPSLVAFSATFAGGVYSVTHEGSKEQFSFRPEDEAGHTAFLDFVARYIPANKAMPKALVRVPARGMTDTPFPSISILSTASLAALEAAAGAPVAKERFRGNIWLEGLSAWEERGWIGKTLRLGEAELVIKEHIGRCRATTANPSSGDQDIDTLKLLKANWGHTELGVYAEVVKAGRVSVGDRAEIL